MSRPTAGRNYLFNFAASHTGGGAKRLHEFARLLDEDGGASFVIHPRSAELQKLFPRNRYFVVSQSQFQRAFRDCAYLDAVVAQTGAPDLYYSYGIPVYERVARVNWFHLSNVLPLDRRGIPLSLFDRVKLAYLGSRIRRSYPNADVISAESEYSLGLIDAGQASKLALSVNGSDQELDAVATAPSGERADIAVVVGTYKYKAIDEAYRVFRMLKVRDPGLRLEIIGNPGGVPKEAAADPDVEVRGMLPRPEVMSTLRKSRYYISTTYIENSYNAASEGVFLSEESYISDIGPHRELLRGSSCEQVSVAGVRHRLLRVKRGEASGAALKRWSEVLADVMDATEAKLDGRGLTGTTGSNAFQQNHQATERVQ